MAKYTININRPLKGGGGGGGGGEVTITDLVENTDPCESVTTFTLNIPEGETRFVIISTSGSFTSASGPSATVGAGTHNYTLTTGGSQIVPDLVEISSVIFRMRDFLGGTVEEEIILTRPHAGTLC